MAESYIDYSCSTSTERLARDIETILSQWHVDRNADRHISSKTNILRSQIIVWNISFFLTNSQKIQCDLELNLALLDGPDPLDDQSHLPYSILRRPPSTTLWRNLSHTFGIGQHIVLSPVNPGALTPSEDKPLNPSYKLLLDYLTRSVLSRYETNSVTSILSQWLQTALNLAAQNCGCRIPLFGLWGAYPLPSHVPLSSDVHAAHKRNTLMRPSTTTSSLTTPILTGQLLADTVSTTFWLYRMVGPTRHWMDWGHTVAPVCHLYCARHVYEYHKRNVPKVSLLEQALGKLDPHDPQAWRQRHVASVDSNERYQNECVAAALEYMRATVGEDWGPPDDPVLSVRMSLGWFGRDHEPILTLPLQSRSRLSSADYQELVNATSSTVLDLQQPMAATLRVRFDGKQGSATARCVLASLIRAATLDASGQSPVHSAAALAKHTDTHTQALVTALDWNEEVMEEWMVADVVNNILRNKEYPELPNKQVTISAPFGSFAKTAAPGRLVSLLFLQMAALKSPSNMILLWERFCAVLRQSWDNREFLPNLRTIPGLDGSAALTGSLYTEPDPEEWYCLVGQKLQVFNLGLETLVMASEFELQVQSASVTTSSLMQGSMVDGVPSIDQNGSGGVVDDDDDVLNRSMDSSSKSVEQFFEANDMGFDAEMTNHRKGARCPIFGATLCETGAQLYAPYLQRALPLTDDVIAERRLVFLQQSSYKASITIEQRLEIAQRFQKPKLLSDMRSFKAANPGATFRDFIGWYGNPKDPLAEFQVPEHDVYAGSTAEDTTVVKLDRATEAIKALEQTRDFWTSTWEEAEPIPASEQEPLFNPESTVEVALDYLENLHPAILTCQVMAVNLAMTHFSISASAGDAMEVPIVKIALNRLRDRINKAVAGLSKDVMRSFEDPVGQDEMLVCSETIVGCSKACEALAAAELIVARCLSLLHKLPKQFHLVERILNNSEGATIDVVEDHVGRNVFLDSVWEQQRKLTAEALPPQPAESEYMMRNLDDSNPCQLCVQHKGNKLGVMKDRPIETILALSRTTRDEY